MLCEFAKSHPRSSLDDATRDLRERCGVDVCSKTARKALRAAGITPGQAAAPSGERRAESSRSSQTLWLHQRPSCQATYGKDNTCLADAESARAADLFERPAGARGMPARLARRISRWALKGVFEVMQDRLRAQWGERTRA